MPAEIETDGDRIFVFQEYFPGIADASKTIKGYKWEKEYEGQPWSYPLSTQVCRDLRELWGKEMVIGPRLTAWARKAFEAERRQREAGRAADADLPRVRASHPHLWEAMSKRTYQRSGAAFMAQAPISGDLDEPGLGKTLTRLASLIEADNWEGRHLVVVNTRQAIENTWGYEIRKWTPDAKVYCMPDGWFERHKMTKAFLADQEGPRFVVVLAHMLQVKYTNYCKKCELWEDEDVSMEHFNNNHTWTRLISKREWPEFFEVEWDSITADECHDYLLKLRPPQSGHQPQWANGLRLLRKNVKPGGSAVAMTGTPFRGKEVNIFGILHFLQPDKYRGFWSWANRYFEEERSEFYIKGGRGATQETKAVGKLREDRRQQFYEDLDLNFLRRTKREVRAELPPMNEIPVWIDMTSKQQKQYDDFAALAEVMLDDGLLRGKGLLSELTRLRQLAFGPWNVNYKVGGKTTKREVLEELELWMQDEEIDIDLYPLVRLSPKTKVLLEMLGERGIVKKKFEPGEKVIIASQFTRVLHEMNMYFTELGIPHLSITGRVAGAARDKAVKSFRFDPEGPRVLFINTKAGGSSLTLDEFCDTMYVLDDTWVRDDTVQLLGRIDNRGQDIRPRFAYHLRTKFTVEETLFLSNAEQQDWQSEILDRRRGVDVARRILKGEA